LLRLPGQREPATYEDIPNRRFIRKIVGIILFTKNLMLKAVVNVLKTLSNSDTAEIKPLKYTSK
jgi:hypothetical protein